MAFFVLGLIFICPQLFINQYGYGNSCLTCSLSFNIKLSRQQETRAKRYQALFKYHIPEEELGRIRSATHSDMALGNERFKEEIEKLTGRRVTPRKRGRKSSQMD